MKFTETARYILGTLVLAAGAALIIVGVSNGETVIVLQKAIKICMECIGIG